jgi:hypothetical protein
MEGHPPHVRVMQLATGYWLSQAMYVAAKLGLADLIASGLKSAAELASATKTHPRALYRLLRALASVGVFTEDTEGNFSQTEMSACLRTGPATQRAFVLMSGDEQYQAFADLEYSVRTGLPAFDKVFGKPVFDYLAGHPDKAANFDQAMVGVHGTESDAIADAYDFAPVKTLIDVGGGNGSLLTAILRRWTHLDGVVYDLAHVVERARPHLPARCTATAGSFFESVPAGGDAYMMRHIIHDWDEPKCLTILGNVRKVIPPAGRLLVAEGVVPAGNGPGFTKLLDLVMLALPGGEERTEAEYAALFAKAGFRLTRVVPTRSEASVIEAVPA